jgi:hypothetical protein
MLKTILIALLPFLVLTAGSDNMLTALNQTASDGESGTLQKMIVNDGSVTLNVDLGRVKANTSKGSAAARESKSTELRFDVQHDAFFTVLVFNNELRGPIPSSMGLVPQNAEALPARMNASQMILESTPWGEQYELVVRDAKTGMVFFNIEGHSFDYDPSNHQLSIAQGRLLLSKEYADELGRQADANSVVGTISMAVTMKDIEVSQIVNGETTSDAMPAQNAAPEAGSVPGPDVIVGDLNGLQQPDAAAGTQVGLSVGTDSCNLGTVDLDWFQTPVNDHPVIPQNMYRMSANGDRMEQIGQSSVKHAFTALTENICSLGCNGTGGTHLGSGCSDPYVTSLNSGGSGHTLGSRAWINPFTGVYPRGDSATPPNVHTGHTHNGTSHRILVEINDLSTSQNPGSTYYAEAMYVTPHEYVWCQTHAGQCNMYNNVSYRQYVVSGTASPFSFSTGGFTTQRAKSAVTAWTGATLVQMEPDPGNDGIGTVGYKVTNPSPGVWHYEYAVYNQNMDRGIQSFSIPVGNGVTLTNVGFHMPPQQPGSTGDGTLNSAGFSSTAWTGTQAGGAITWASETLAQNQNANAIRWGTMYNFRFDSNQPPAAMSATVGFYKTGNPITVAVQGPQAAAPTGPFSITGRVFTSAGIPVRNAEVSITNQSTNTILNANTSSLGYYVFSVPTNGTWIVNVSSKRYNFNPLNLSVSGNLADQDMIAQPDPNGRSFFSIW